MQPWPQAPSMYSGSSTFDWFWPRHQNKLWILKEDVLSKEKQKKLLVSILCYLHSFWPMSGLIFWWNCVVIFCFLVFEQPILFWIERADTMVGYEHQSFYKAFYSPRRRVWQPCSETCSFSLMWHINHECLSFQCSRTCDKGTQSRKTYCVSDDQIRDQFLCDSSQKPETLRMCNLRPCKADWFIGKWNKVGSLTLFP